MSDHPLVQALHAAISRRSWIAVEQAANRIRDDRRITWPDSLAAAGEQKPCDGCDGHECIDENQKYQCQYPGASTSDAGGGVREELPPLTCDFARAFPDGTVDNSTYGKIEDALDKIDAPCQGANGRWLSLHERIAALSNPAAADAGGGVRECDHNFILMPVGQDGSPIHGVTVDRLSMYPEAMFCQWCLKPKGVQALSNPAAADSNASADDYREAIDEALVVRYLGVAKGNAKAELDQIISWEVDVNLDPAVSSRAQALIDQGRNASAEARLRDALSWAVSEIELAGKRSRFAFPEDAEKKKRFDEVKALALSPDPHASDCDKQGETTAPLSCPDCHDESDCSHVDICRAVEEVYSETTKSEGGVKAGAPAVSPEVLNTAGATRQFVGERHPSDRPADVSVAELAHWFAYDMPLDGRNATKARALLDAFTVERR